MKNVLNPRLEDHLVDQAVRIYEGLRRQVIKEDMGDTEGTDNAGIEKAIEDINTKVNAIIDALGLEPVDASDTPTETPKDDTPAEEPQEEVTDVFAVNDSGEPVNSGGGSSASTSSASGEESAEEPVHEGLDFDNIRVGEVATNPVPTSGYTLILRSDAIDKLGWTQDNKHFDTLNALMAYIAKHLPMNYREYDVLRNNNFKYNSGTIFSNSYFDVQKNGEDKEGK